MISNDTEIMIMHQFEKNKNTPMKSWTTQWHDRHWMPAMLNTLYVDIKCKLKGWRVSQTDFLSNRQQNWTHSQDLTRVSSVDLTCVHSPRGKQSLAQHKKHFCVSYTCEVQGKTGKDVQCNVLRLASLCWSAPQQETREPLSTRTETTGLPS